MMLTGRSSVFDVNLVQTLTKLYKKFCGVRLILPLYFSRAPCLKRWRQKKKEGFLSFSAHVASSLWSECTFHKPFLSAADTLSCSLCLIETHTLENTRISTCLSLNRPVFSALLLHISIPASFSLCLCHRDFGVMRTIVQLSGLKQMVRALFNQGQISAPLFQLDSDFRWSESAFRAVRAWHMTHWWVRVMLPVCPADSEDRLPGNAFSVCQEVPLKTRQDSH